MPSDSDPRIMIYPEHLEAHKPLCGDPDWLTRTGAFVGCISTTSWRPEDPSDEPVVHVIALDKTDAEHLVERLTQFLAELPTLELEPGNG